MKRLFLLNDNIYSCNLDFHPINYDQPETRSCNFGSGSSVMTIPSQRGVAYHVLEYEGLAMIFAIVCNLFSEILVVWSTMWIL